jgi:hypothetical protein
MKKHLIIILLCITAISSARAQEYKVNKSSGKMTINLSSVTIEGYSGNQIVFSSQKNETKADPRAAGLRAINGSGYTDNTGLGISVTEKGSGVEVNQATASDQSIKILVPKGVIISYGFHKVQNAGKVYFKNMENEIEISTDYNSVDLEDVTGPVSVRALYGAVDAKFSNHIKGPISIVAIYSAVDVTIPADTKANINLNTTHGAILASPEFKIEMKKNTDDDLVSYSSNISGKLNGGGLDFKLTSEYGKIYLRKAK